MKGFLRVKVLWESRGGLVRTQPQSLQGEMTNEQASQDHNPENELTGQLDGRF